MKYLIGVLLIWVLMGLAGAVLLGERGIHPRTIGGGPISLWIGLNKPPNK